MEEKNERIGLKNELIRKSIHLGSLIIPISYYFLEKNFVLWVVGVGSALMVLIDLMRKFSPAWNNFYIKLFGKALRKKEFDVKNHFFTGGTYYAIGLFLGILLFKKEIAAPALMIMIVSDTFAALIGKKFGKHTIWNKTIEGSVAFFISGLAIVLLTPKVTAEINEYLIAITALLITTVLEAVPIEVDDNILIPLVFGTTYTLLLHFI